MIIIPREHPRRKGPKRRWMSVHETMDCITDDRSRLIDRILELLGGADNYYAHIFSSYISCASQNEMAKQCGLSRNDFMAELALTMEKVQQLADDDLECVELMDRNHWEIGGIL